MPLRRRNAKGAVRRVSLSAYEIAVQFPGTDQPTSSTGNDRRSFSTSLKAIYKGERMP
jgi:hypothetical protein